MKLLLRALVAACAISIATGVSAGVIVGDKEWRQVTETVNLTYGDLASVCNSTTGACSGSVGGVDFSAWTWASQADVAQLFQGLPGWFGPLAPQTSFVQLELDSLALREWVDSFRALGLGTTQLEVQEVNMGIIGGPPDEGLDAPAEEFTAEERSDRTIGWLREIPEACSTCGFTAGVYIFESIERYEVQASVGHPVDTSNTNFGPIGGWFYRSTTPSVPAPPTLGLLLVPALALVARRNRRQRKTSAAA